MSYEFNTLEETVIKNVGIRAIFLTIVIVISGTLNLIIALNQFSDRSFIVLSGMIILVIVQFVIAAVLFLPANNFRNIAKTTGNDIDELMQGINKLTFATKIIVGGLATSILLLLALIMVL